MFVQSELKTPNLPMLKGGVRISLTGWGDESLCDSVSDPRDFGGGVGFWSLWPASVVRFRANIPCWSKQVVANKIAASQLTR